MFSIVLVFYILLYTIEIKKNMLHQLKGIALLLLGVLLFQSQNLMLKLTKTQ